MIDSLCVSGHAEKGMEVFHMAAQRNAIIQESRVASLFDGVAHDPVHVKTLTMYALKWNSLRDFHSRSRIINALVGHGNAASVTAALDCVGSVEYPVANAILCNALLVTFSKVSTIIAAHMCLVQLKCILRTDE